MRRISALDGLRGLAALSVAVLHYQPAFFGAWPVRWVTLCPLLFFIISGLILTLRYEKGLATGNTKPSTFMIHRVTRMWPLHLFALALLIAEQIYFSRYGIPILRADDTAATFVANALLVQNWGLVDVPTWNIPAWSISTEWAINLAWMAALIWLRWNVLIAAVLIVASGYLLWNTNDGLLYPPMAPVLGPITHGILTTTAGFSLGCLVAWCYGRMPQLRFSSSFGVAAAGAALLALAFYNHLPGHIDFMLFFVLTPILVLLALQAHTPLNALLSCGPLRWLGTISYSVYLLHAPLVHAMTLFVTWQIPLPEPPWRGLIWLAAVLVVSTITYYLIEQPAIHWGRRLTRTSILPSRDNIVHAVDNDLEPVPRISGNGRVGESAGRSTSTRCLVVEPRATIDLEAPDTGST